MEIFKLFGSVMIDSTEANKSLSKTGQEAEGLGSKLKNGIATAAKWATGVAAAASAVGGAMIAAAKSTASNLDTIDKASQRMSMNAESYQELAYQANLCGVEMSTMEKAAKKLEGTDMSMDDALASIWELGTAEERSAKAAELFGDSVAYSLSPMLNASAEEMAAMAQEANDLGLIMSQDTVSAGASMNDMFTKVESSIEALKSSLMADFMPYIAEILQWLLDNMPMIQETVKSVMDAIMPIVKTVLDILMEIIPPVFNLVKELLDWLIPYIEPIVNGIRTLLEGFMKLLHGDIKGYVENCKETLTLFGKALFGIGKDIMNYLWSGIKNVWSSISKWVSEKVSWIKDKLTFWKSSSDSMDSSKVNGSHASGLNYVPYDGYVAELHRGESVLNAGSVQQLMDALKNVGSNSEPINITVQSVLDGKIIGESTYNYMNTRKAMFGV